MDRVILKLRYRLLAWLHRSRPPPMCFVRRFSYKEIKKATDGFHRIVYSNYHSAAYKAIFRDGGVSLVKEVREFDQGKDSFYRQVQLLERLHHRHLLTLKGFSAGHKRLLVFDHVENGSLKEHLNDPLRTPLNWRTRIQIAMGVVAALEYLFLFNEPQTYYASVNSSSIMLDENFNAKLSDVGLLGPGGKCVNMPYSSCSEDCAGMECGNLVFQLGVLLLELVTGQSSEDSDVIEWIQGSRFHNSMNNMIDPDLGNSFDSREIKTLLAVAKLCIKSKNKPTLSIPKLFHYLQKEIDI